MQGTSRVLDRIISELTFETFQKEKYKLIFRVLMFSAIVIFCVETLIMLAIEFY